MKKKFSNILIFSFFVLVTIFVVFAYPLYNHGWFSANSKEYAVLTDKFVYEDSEAGIFTNGKITVATGRPSEYQALLCDGYGNKRYFRVSQEEYEELNIGSFYEVWKRTNIGSKYSFIMLSEHGDINDKESNGKLLDLRVVE